MKEDFLILFSCCAACFCAPHLTVNMIHLCMNSNQDCEKEISALFLKLQNILIVVLLLVSIRNITDSLPKVILQKGSCVKI